ncbi:MAG: hypothetical protein AB7Q29_02890 [Vicinamibacterales bacterium]
MILAILDDLLFTSKIRATAAQAGVPLMFARTIDAALEQLRATRPSLVMLDLDNPRIDALRIAAELRESRLSGVSSVAFVSHVRTDLIQQARDAGIGEVLPRSAFVTRLPEIFARHQPPAGGDAGATRSPE